MIIGENAKECLSRIEAGAALSVMKAARQVCISGRCPSAQDWRSTSSSAKFSGSGLEEAATEKQI